MLSDKHKNNPESSDVSPQLQWYKLIPSFEYAMNPPSVTRSAFPVTSRTWCQIRPPANITRSPARMSITCAAFDSTNPTSGTVTAQWEADKPGEAKYLVTTIDGRHAEEGSVKVRPGINEPEVDLKGLPNGTYILTIFTEGKTISRKVVKAQ